MAFTSVAARRVVRIGLLVIGVAGAPLIVLPAADVDALVVLRALMALSFLASGFVAWERRPLNGTGAILMLLGLASIAGSLMGPPTTTEPLLWTIGIVWRLAWSVGFVWLLLAFPSGRLRGRFDRTLVTAVFVVAVPMQVLWLMFEPHPLGAPANAFLVWPSEAAADAIDAAQRIVFLATAVVLVRTLARRWRRASRPQRRTLAPALAGAATVLAFSVLVIVNRFSAVPKALDIAVLLADATVPLALLWSVLRARFARTSVADLVLELQASAAPPDLREALARALGDPSLTVAYWLPDYAGYADADGRRVDLPEAEGRRATTLIDVGGERVAALVHDVALRDEGTLVDSVCAAAGLALEKERLQAELLARLEELRASRSRIVEAADAERRRIERNLHDGIQQRLVSIAMALGLAESKLTAEPSQAQPIVAGAREDVLCALAELRELGRGIHPGVLTERGLKTALHELTYRTPIPLDLDVCLERRLPEPVEAAVYFIVCEALANVAKHADAAAARVDVRVERGRVIVEVADDGSGGADLRGSGLRGLCDRAEALGGTLTLESPPGVGTMVHVVIPCG